MSEFTPEQKETINRNWKDGKCPKECIGKCDIDPGVFIMSFCNACCWNDGGHGSSPGDDVFNI